MFVKLIFPYSLVRSFFEKTTHKKSLFRETFKNETKIGGPNVSTSGDAGRDYNFAVLFHKQIFLSKNKKKKIANVV